MLLINKYKYFFATLNFVLMFIGYSVATSLFLPISSDVEGISRSVTVPYRIFQLSVALICIILNFNELFKNKPLTWKLFILFWIIYIMRMVYDLHISSDNYVIEKAYFWALVLGTTISSIISISASYRYINIDKSLNFIFIGYVFVIFFSLIFNQSILFNISDTRLSANIALNALEIGYLCTSLIIITLYHFFQQKSIIIKGVTIITAILCFIVLLKIGSRGPVASLIIVLLFWWYIKSNYKAIFLGTTALLSVLLSVFIDKIILFTSSFAPVFAMRFSNTLFDGDSSGRDIFFDNSLDVFLNNPLIGKQFAFFYNGKLIYSHNIFMDIAIGLGVIGLLLFCIIFFKNIKSIKYSIKNNNPTYLVYLLLLQQYVGLQFSSSIYYNSLFNGLIAYTLIDFYYNHEKNNAKLWYKTRGIRCRNSNISGHK